MSGTPGAVVLLVQPRDDDGLEMYAEFLRYHGLFPLAVSNARDALAVAPQADVIVTGIVLPGSTDGIGLIVQLRSNEPTKHTPIIVLTACAWERERCQHAGCDVLLSKPCLPDALLREVRRLLAASNSRRPRRRGRRANRLHQVSNIGSAHSVTSGSQKVIMRTIHDVIQLVRSEYREMPGLRLKPEQLQRLCAIERTICQMVLDALVNEHFLCVNPDGTYVRVTEGRVFYPQSAKADIRTRTRSKNAS